MRCFALNEAEAADLVLREGRLEMVSGEELLRQKVRRVIGTGRGEWFLDEGEGLDRGALLGKSPDADRVRSEIAAALAQVDASMLVREFAMRRLEGRRMAVVFTAAAGDGQELEITGDVGG